jgi:hypothetical protein
VQVEDVTGEPDSDAEEEEDVHQEAGPSTMTKKRRGNNQYRGHCANNKKSQ